MAVLAMLLQDPHDISMISRHLAASAGGVRKSGTTWSTATPIMNECVRRGITPIPGFPNPVAMVDSPDHVANVAILVTLPSNSITPVARGRFRNPHRFPVLVLILVLVVVLGPLRSSTTVAASIRLAPISAGPTRFSTSIPTVCVRFEPARVSRMRLPSKTSPDGSPRTRIPAVPGSRPLSSMTVALQPIAVRRHPRGLVAEEHAVGPVADHPVAAQQVIRIFVTDRDAEPPVALEAVVLEYSVADAPAQEQSIRAIAERGATPHHGTL